MQNRPYRYLPGVSRVVMGFVVMVHILGAIALTSCKKDPEPGTPQISFIMDEGYLSHDTIIPAGQKVRIGIRAEGLNANITYFSVRFDNGTSQILLDSGMNTPSLVYTLEVIKTNDSLEKWTFLIMDRTRVETSIQIALSKSEISNWGKIRTMSDIMLGGQEHPTIGSFFSLNESRVMDLDEAFENQPIVDMVYYFGQYEGTLASPNEAEAPEFFTGPHGIANWTVKNESRYDTTLITPLDFDRSDNDSLILAAYEPTAGKKKGKYTQPGMIFSIRSPEGKLGLVKIQEVLPAPAGSVKMTIKIQE